MRALVFGQSGQVARELARCVPLGITARFLPRTSADLLHPDDCAAAIRACDIVINAAAWTAVDLAESQPNDAQIVNASAPSAMALACAAQGLPIIHLSSDYVFDGSGALPFAPNHPPSPLGAYGASKLGGEIGVRASGARYVILRTSWVFSPFKTNFLKTMLRLGAQNASLNVVADQIGGPTPASAIANAVWIIGQALGAGHPGGTYHLAGAPDTSWADFARAIMAAAQLSCRITDIAAKAYPTAAPRPANSRLDCQTTTRVFGIPRPDWRAAIAPILQEIAQ